jgi:tRNA-dihydrouridine synthase A
MESLVWTLLIFVAVPVDSLLSPTAELFSVAPMMGHTDRHYRTFFRLLSQQAYLYTEMVPAAQIVRAYKRARWVYLRRSIHDDFHPDELLEVAARLSADPDREWMSDTEKRTLSSLIGISSADDRTVLQLGGNDPELLGAASAIGAAIGNYKAVNLNCGCPSTAVTGFQSSGAALMKDPNHVAACVEHMKLSLDSVGCSSGQQPCISVKHRLGVRDAGTFDAAADRLKGDDEAYTECRDFCHVITRTGAVSKCHVHARLALLGEFEPSETRNPWVTSVQATDTPTRVKVDHKRVQARSKKQARQATIQNRNVPPLRPLIVQRLAQEFPQIEFVANGGIECLADVQATVDSGLYGSQETRVVGAMVGRAVINHPCSFAAADVLWDAAIPRQRPTRIAVLQDYLTYCDQEEDRLRILGAPQSVMNDLTRKLAAVPFHLFVGEEGNHAFQRSIRKVISKTVRVKARSILSGAASFLPDETLDKGVDDFATWDQVVKYDGSRRSGAMQRVVY